MNARRKPTPALVAHRAGIDLNTGEEFNPWADLKELAFQQAVYNFAHAHGWLVAHFRTVEIKRAGGRPSYHATAVGFDGVGWPDLVLVRDGAILFRELKTDTGSTSIEQDAWLGRLAAAGQDVGIWRPRAYALITATLSAGTTYRTRQQLAEEIATRVLGETHLDHAFRARVADAWRPATKRSRKHA